ncbi:hypothetical protein TSUD_56320 [Trifolium subterraneum]|uniref:Uncharacterized protein n=1 Tax=Trifolium subterraneum TaxID=3900 RepID=A0A2Z6MUT7_TRISU|nr:hypothetical protein TSUD_56320 [Trifolium subterraneum]
MVHPNSVVMCDEGGGGRYGVGRDGDVSTVVSCRFVILWILIEDDDKVIVVEDGESDCFFLRPFSE